MPRFPAVKTQVFTGFILSQEECRQIGEEGLHIYTVMNMASYTMNLVAMDGNNRIIAEREIFRGNPAAEQPIADVKRGAVCGEAGHPDTSHFCQQNGNPVQYNSHGERQDLIIHCSAYPHRGIIDCGLCPYVDIEAMEVQKNCGGACLDGRCPNCFPHTSEETK